METEWDDGYGEDEWADEGWGTDDDESVDTIPCRNCGAEVYEEAEQCPHCGEWGVRGHSTAMSDRPIWWQVIGVLGIIAVIAALLL